MPGFDVTGVDIAPMPHYRGGTFVQADALDYPLDGFDFVWASPPPSQICSSAKRSSGTGRREWEAAYYPDLLVGRG